jgi:hypothetical protein
LQTYDKVGKEIQGRVAGPRQKDRAIHTEISAKDGDF